MFSIRRAILLASLVALLATGARAGAPTDAELEGLLLIKLEHHWVVEVGGRRFGLIQFDTPSTTVLLGGFDFDLPVPALVVLAPLLAVPALAAVGVVMHGRHRRHGYYS